MTEPRARTSAETEGRAHGRKRADRAAASGPAEVRGGERRADERHGGGRPEHRGRVTRAARPSRPALPAATAGDEERRAARRRSRSPRVRTRRARTRQRTRPPRPGARDPAAGGPRPGRSDREHNLRDDVGRGARRHRPVADAQDHHGQPRPGPRRPGRPRRAVAAFGGGGGEHDGGAAKSGASGNVLQPVGTEPRFEQ